MSSLRAPAPQHLLALAISLAGCASEPLFGVALPRTFELRSVGAQPVPAIYTESSYGRSTVIRGSLTFLDEEHVRWAWDEDLVFRPSPQEPFTRSSYSYQTTLTYRLTGTELQIGEDCPPDPLANCAPPMPGRITGSQLVLDPEFSRAPWLFEQADPVR